jgi:hypothetical protein
MPENPLTYLTSKEAKEELKVQNCDIAHIRNSGKLQFTKKGNSYLYLKESIEKYKTKN